jgi:hypothetical protein
MSSGKQISSAIKQASEQINLILKRKVLPEYDIKQVLYSIPPPLGVILNSFFDSIKGQTNEKAKEVLAKLNILSHYDEESLEKLVTDVTDINRIRFNIYEALEGSENEILIECLKTLLTDIDQIAFERKKRSLSDTANIISFDNVKDFWSAHNELNEGVWVKVFGTFSEYAPLTLGISLERKREHFNWRTSLSTMELQTPLSDIELPSPVDVGIDGVMSLSSGNAIIRFEPFVLPNSEKNRYAGLYQAIGRNSISLVVDEGLFQKFKNENGIKKTHTYDVEITGTTERPSRVFSTFTTIQDQFDSKPIIIQVVGKGAGIKYVSKTTFFEADIWGIFSSKSNKKKLMIVRCPDFSDVNTLGYANKEIKDEVISIFGNDFIAEAQYDYVAKPFATVVKESEQTIGEAQEVVKLIRDIYKNLEEHQDKMRDMRKRREKVFQVLF